MKFSAAVLSLCVASASAFAPASIKTSSSTKLFNDPNQNPFGAYNAAAVPAAAPAAAPAGAPAAGGDANQNVFGTKSLEFQGNEGDESFKTVRLRDRLNEADTERRKDEDAADLRERAAEIAREERLQHCLHGKYAR